MGIGHYGKDSCLRRSVHAPFNEIQEGDRSVLPAHARSEDTQWLPSYFVMLVHHQEIGRPSFRFQCIFSMSDRPFQFLDSDQDLSQHSIDLCLARIQASNRCDTLLSVENEPAGGKDCQMVILEENRILPSRTSTSSLRPFASA